MQNPSDVELEPSHQLNQLRQQQTVLAKFGELALRCDKLDEILTEACRLVGEGLGTDLAKVMTLEDGGETLLVRAGVGWKPGIVGVLTLKVAESKLESLAFQTGDPTISPNIATETRFEYPAFLIDNGVKAMANVAIIGRDGRPPFGLLQINSRAPRLFTDDDTAFLRSYANLIAAAVERLHVLGDVRAALVKASDAQQAADRASHSKSRFLAHMSHELRTPLNGILGYAQLLHLEGGLSVTQAARVDNMLGAGEHLLQMINSVLDLSEIEADHIEIQPIEFSLRSLAETCLGFIRPAAEAKGLGLGLMVAPDAPVSVVADPTRLRQILLNLLGNALKFTKRGSVELRLRLSFDGNKLRVEVADTGPGISAEQRGFLFRDFERLDNEATHTVEGAGLGLAISARLTALLGGRIGHEDNPPGGSVFWLELPLGAGLYSAPPSAKVTTTALPLPDPLAILTPLRALRVLVVDDVAMNRDIAGAFLCANGHEVTYAEGGLEAVAVVTTTDFDVVLMDVRMPKVDGIEATRRIRLLKGPRRHVPIVALTAQAFPEQVELCRQAGMNSHVTKPFTPDVLNDAVVHAAAKHPFPANMSSTAI
jgi:signal transduction histidine kinase